MTVNCASSRLRLGLQQQVLLQAAGRVGHADLVLLELHTARVRHHKRLCRRLRLRPCGQDQYVARSLTHSQLLIVKSIAQTHIFVTAKPWTRIWVIIFSQVVAAPFTFCVLFVEPPYSYYFLIPSYIFGEYAHISQQNNLVSVVYSRS